MGYNARNDEIIIRAICAAPAASLNLKLKLYFCSRPAFIGRRKGLCPRHLVQPLIFFMCDDGDLPFPLAVVVHPFPWSDVRS